MASGRAERFAADEVDVLRKGLSALARDDRGTGNWTTRMVERIDDVDEEKTA